MKQKTFLFNEFIANNIIKEIFFLKKLKTTKISLINCINSYILDKNKSKKLNNIFLNKKLEIIKSICLSINSIEDAIFAINSLQKNINTINSISFSNMILNLIEILDENTTKFDNKIEYIKTFFKEIFIKEICIFKDENIKFIKEKSKLIEKTINEIRNKLGINEYSKIDVINKFNVHDYKNIFSLKKNNLNMNLCNLFYENIYSGKYEKDTKEYLEYEKIYLKYLLALLNENLDFYENIESIDIEDENAFVKFKEVLGFYIYKEILNKVKSKLYIPDNQKISPFYIEILQENEIIFEQLINNNFSNFIGSLFYRKYTDDINLENLSEFKEKNNNGENNELR